MGAGQNESGPTGPGFYNRRMTDAIAFDSHRFVKRLTENGFTEQQAETVAEEHVARLEAGVETLRQETKTDIAESGTRLLMWMFGAMIAQGGLIVALIKLL